MSSESKDEAVEHLTLDELAADNGDEAIWTALDARFPDKLQHDHMAESLKEVFQLSAREGESMAAWTSRVQDTFSRCRRKVNVEFPPEARGWIVLHQSGLTEDQRAIVTAKNQGDMKFDTMMVAMRKSLDHRKSARKLMIPADAVVFEEVEAFLSEHGVASPEGEVDNECFNEEDVVEILAASWKEKRSEISRLQKSRRFGQVSAVKRAFANEVSELKTKSKCFKCHKIGHWARNCPNKKAENPSASGAAVVWSLPTSGAATVINAEEVMLISSPCFGVIDSGCGRTLIGQATLGQVFHMLKEKGKRVPTLKKSQNLFRFGNGQEELSEKTATIPVGIHGEDGHIEAAVIQGDAPLLLSRSAMKSLGASLDFEHETLTLKGRESRPVQVNSAGQFIVNVMDFSEIDEVLSTNHYVTENDKVTDFEPVPDEMDIIHFDEVTSTKEAPDELETELSQLPKGKVAELFSPPRFAEVAAKRGQRGLSYDLLQGWDLTKPKVQQQVSQELAREQPELLVCCPECKHWRGWYRLNRNKLSLVEQCRNKKVAKKQAQLVVEEAKQQLKRGGRVLIEHPWSSDLWKYPPMAKLLRRMHLCRVDLCAYGLCCPDSGLPIRKPTGIAVSHVDMVHLAAQCPGHPKHQLVEGKCLDGELRSAKTARYTTEFCERWLSCVDHLSPPPSVLYSEEASEKPCEWPSWAGVPVEVICDPARTNIADMFVDPLELQGVRVLTTAAEAHNQLGKVEKHGHLFEVILQKLIDQVQPQNQLEYEECIFHAMNSKNEMLNSKGLSPCQHVFGRNPRVPEDLIQDNPDPVRTSAIRAAARSAVATSQDDRSLREALNARPRVERDFVAGDFVHYWRTQKYMNGVRLVGGRWFGTAIVMGKIGRNVLVFHRRHLFKVTPEHLRHATLEERAVAQSDGRELLGISDLVSEGNNLLGSQYVDLSNQEKPPSVESYQIPNQAADATDVWERRGNFCVRVHNRLRVGRPGDNIDRPWSMQQAATQPLQAEPWLGETWFEIQFPDSDQNTGLGQPSSISQPPSEDVQLFDDSELAPEASPPETSAPRVMPYDKSASASSSRAHGYGPLRFRTRDSTNSSEVLIRPPSVFLDDFQEAMEEVSNESREKRSASREPSGSPSAKAAKHDDRSEVLFAELRSMPNAEALVAGFLQKRMQTELHHSNNPPALQEQIDDAKVIEFVHTLQEEKKALKVIPPKQASKIRTDKPDRIMTSRFVVTNKVEDQTSKIKARVEHSSECRVLNLSWTQLLVQVGTDYLEHFQLSIVSLLATMSLSKSPNAPLSADEARTLTSLLMRMQAAGLEPAADHQGYGAMTDASKRRKPESEVSLEEEFEHIEPFVQYEVEKLETEKPKSSTDGSVGKTRVHIPLVNVGGVKIPPNEKDMEDWSTTICELPKVLHLGMSYAELIADPEFMDYLIWVRTHGVKKGGRFEDFSLFLQAVDYTKERVCPNSHQTFPGSNQIRKKKAPVDKKKNPAS
eukprot:symbB.v1.2.002836.t1/scaffold144.1/size299099/14